MHDPRSSRCPDARAALDTRLAATRATPRRGARWALGLACLLGAPGAGAQAPVEAQVEGQVQAQAPRPPIVEAPLNVVGVLTAQSVADCDARGQPTGAAAQWHEVGFTRLVGAPEGLSALVGRPVMATGLSAAPPHQGQPASQLGAHCFEMQMRSDWVATGTGMRQWRGPSGAPARLAVGRVAPFEGLRLRRHQDRLVVQIENVFAVPLEGVKLTLQAEGCYGKPGSTSVEEVMGIIAPGAKVERRLPLRLDRPEGPHARPYVAHSVRLEAQAPRVFFDLDWRLSAAGIEARCP